MMAEVDLQKFNPNNLIINYLPAALTDAELGSLFGSIGAIKSTKIVRDKTTGMSLGFGFVEFINDGDAGRAIDAFDGLTLQNKRLKVAYARRTGGNETVGANVHVRNLEQTVSSKDVEQRFSEFGEIIRARVLNDPNTGMSRGIAFVLFGRRDDAEKAVSSLNGANVPGFARAPLCVRFAIDNKTKAQALAAAAGGGLAPGVAFPTAHPYLAQVPNAQATAAMGLGSGYGTAFGGGPVRASAVRQRFNPLGVIGQVPNATTVRPQAATHRVQVPDAGVMGGMGQNMRPNLPYAVPGMPAATVPRPIGGGPGIGLPVPTSPGHVIFVYNLGQDADDRDLWQLFAPFGAVQRVNIVYDTEKSKCKGYGFVTMTNFEEAMIAIGQLNGFTYKEKQLQVSLKTQKVR